MVLLINDANYPWTVLVPKRADITEIYKLDHIDQMQLLEESAKLCNAMETVCKPDKLNIAAIGNMVPQLHLHHIARYRTDIAWPAPVWGFAKPLAYETEIKDQTVSKIAALLTDC